MLKDIICTDNNSVKKKFWENVGGAITNSNQQVMHEILYCDENFYDFKLSASFF